MPNDRKVKAERVFGRLMRSIPSFRPGQGLRSRFEQIGSYASLLYDQALLMAGMTIEDPVAFSNAICELMTQAVS